MAKILIVDDSKFMRLTLRNFIFQSTQGPHEIEEAENVAQAVEKFKAFQPDLITMDIIMPQESGLEAVKRIKEIDPNARIVMVSAMGQEKIVEEAFSLGAKWFIVKPINSKELKDTIKRVLDENK